MFHFKKEKKTAHKTYDASVCKPVLKCSICTGEQVAGFQDLKTGKFDDMALIRDEKELQEFLDTYGLTDIEKIY